MSPPGIRRLILASTSPARRSLLASLGYAFDAVAPLVDEDLGGLQHQLSPPEQAQRLAERKAQAVLARSLESVVIGGDQVVALGARIYSKPATAEDAFAQLASLRGTTHCVHTAVCVAMSGGLISRVETARVTMRPLSDDELHRYIRTGEWQGCAGGYRIEALGRWLFSAVEGDLTGVQGLPLLALVDALSAARVPPPFMAPPDQTMTP